MFTGLVEDVGKLLNRAPRAGGARLRIATAMPQLVLGESIAVMGVCLTVDAIESDGFHADASSETLERTTLGRLPVGHGVHLERAMKADGRFGGHIVSGHVDGVGRLLARQAAGAAMSLRFSYGPSLAPYLAVKGSVTVDGVSLTVNDVSADQFAVMIIPHTQGATGLPTLRVGDEVNLEVDVLARYVVRWLQVGGNTQAPGDADAREKDQALLRKLSESGYL